jgi:hypothetical protein
MQFPYIYIDAIDFFDILTPERTERESSGFFTTAWHFWELEDGGKPVLMDLDPWVDLGTGQSTTTSRRNSDWD